MSPVCIIKAGFTGSALILPNGPAIGLVELPERVLASAERDHTSIDIHEILRGHISVSLLLRSITGESKGDKVDQRYRVAIKIADVAERHDAVTMT